MNGHPQRLTGRAHLFQLVHTDTGEVEQVRGLTQAEAQRFNAALAAAGSPLRWRRDLPDELPALGG